MITDINSEDRLVQRTFADHLRDALGWKSVYAYNEETFGPAGTLGHASGRDVVLVREVRPALQRALKVVKEKKLPALVDVIAEVR